MTDGRLGFDRASSASCATVCTMLASGLWPVNTLSRRRVAGRPDEALQPTAPGASTSTAAGMPRRRGWPAASSPGTRPPSSGCRPVGRSSTACRSTSDRRPGRRAGSCSARRSRSTWRAAGRPATSSSPTCATPGGMTPGDGPPVSPSGTSCRSASRSPATRSSTGPAGRRPGSSGAGSRSTRASSAGAPARSPRSRISRTRSWTGAGRTPRQGPGRYAPPGQSGSLTIMPGTYGGNQVGMSDFVPSPAAMRSCGSTRSACEPERGARSRSVSSR